MTKVSVIIPNYNSAELLRRGLNALRESETTWQKLHEIIVVDDASTDDSVKVAEDLGAIVYKLDTNFGPARARNYGAERATGDVLWFLDADVEVMPGSVELLVKYFSDNPDRAAVFGSYDQNPSQPNACSQFKNLFHHYVHQKADGPVSSFWSGCGAIRAEAFAEVGGFDCAYWRDPSVEDIHLGYMLGRHGYDIRVLKGLQVRHHKRWSLVGMVKTDVFKRAVPWTAMILRNRGTGSSELNLNWHYRASIIAVYLAILAVPGGLFFPWILAAIPFLLGSVVMLNLELVSFFRKRNGTIWLLQAVPLLWFYFFYCGVGFVLGVGLYLYERRSGRHAFSERDTGRSPNP